VSRAHVRGASGGASPAARRWRGSGEGKREDHRGGTAARRGEPKRDSMSVALERAGYIGGVPLGLSQKGRAYVADAAGFSLALVGQRFPPPFQLGARTKCTKKPSPGHCVAIVASTFHRGCCCVALGAQPANKPPWLGSGRTENGVRSVLRLGRAGVVLSIAPSPTGGDITGRRPSERPPYWPGGACRPVDDLELGDRGSI